MYVLQVSDRSPCFPDGIRAGAGGGAAAGGGGGGGGKLLVSEYHATALPALAALASYHAYLEPQTQQRIVRCLLKYGMGEHFTFYCYYELYLIQCVVHFIVFLKVSLFKNYIKNIKLIKINNVRRL